MCFNILYRTTYLSGKKKMLKVGIALLKIYHKTLQPVGTYYIILYKEPNFKYYQWVYKRKFQ